MTAIGSLESLSPGCRLCQQGKWLCIFLTELCDADCPFCPCPQERANKTTSAFGDDLPAVLNNLERGAIEGISFSGGECFLVFERMLTWLTSLKARFPDMYFWAYTNGLAANSNQLKILADCGLNELRFNIAASGYCHRDVLEKIEVAVKLLEVVSIEIPSIPAHHAEVAAVLPSLNNLGVKFLNLHEYILVPQVRAEEGSVGTFLLNHTARLRFHKFSCANSDSLDQVCKRQNLKLLINNCTLRKKETQMQQRRLAMGRILKYEYEELTPDGFLRTFIVGRDSLSLSDSVERLRSGKGVPAAAGRFVHPSEVSSYCSKQNGEAVELLFLPPVDIDGMRILYRMKAQ